MQIIEQRVYDRAVVVRTAPFAASRMLAREAVQIKGMETLYDDAWDADPEAVRENACLNVNSFSRARHSDGYMTVPNSLLSCYYDSAMMKPCDLLSGLIGISLSAVFVNLLDFNNIRRGGNKQPVADLTLFRQLLAGPMFFNSATEPYLDFENMWPGLLITTGLNPWLEKTDDPMNQVGLVISEKAVGSNQTTPVIVNMSRFFDADDEGMLAASLQFLPDFEIPAGNDLV